MKHHIYNRMSPGLAVTAALALLLFGACQKAINFTGDETSRFVVLKSVAETDSTIKMRLTYSRFFLSSEDFRTVDNAEIYLYCNGKQVMPSSSDDLFHYYDCRPQPGDTLSLAVEVPGYEHGTLTAGARVPQRPQLQYVSCEESEDADGQQGCDIHLRLADPAGKNYYALRLRSLFVNGQTPAMVTCHYYNDVFQCNEPLFSDVTSGSLIGEIGGEDNDVRSLIFSDDNFNGKTVDFTIRYNFTHTFYDTTLAKLQVQMTAMNEDYYLYTVTSKAATKDDMTAMFGEAVQVHGNVKNGIGIFGAQSTTLLPVKIDKAQQGGAAKHRR